MMKQIDLHVHSNASDGTYTPTELVNYAVQKNLLAFALTDHDTVSGIEEAKRAASQTSVECIPGIELSSEYKGGEIHILGLYIDYKKAELSKALEEFIYAREARNEEMAEKLRKEGFQITIQELRTAYPNAVLTRAHFAKFLKETNQVKSYEEVFKKYIDKNGCCYVPKRVIKPQDAIELIRKANGVPVLAHPLLYHLEIGELKKLLKQLKEYGLRGLEVFYSMNCEGDDNRLASLAKELGLLMTGGSDFHGSTKPHIDLGNGRGTLYVSDSLLEPIREAWKERK